MLMAVMMPREQWSGERLDELNTKVDDGFARVDKDPRELRSEIDGLRSGMKLRPPNRRLMWSAIGELTCL
jgi:hypothetical protein